VFGQRSQLYGDLPPIESFELLLAIYAVPRSRYKRNLYPFTATLALGDFLQTPVRQRPLAQRMRGDFAAALLHAPPVVLLQKSGDGPPIRRLGLKCKPPVERPMRRCRRPGSMPASVTPFFLRKNWARMN